jgi:hypothetical protein
MILLLAAGIGISVRPANRTDTNLFMKSDSSAYQKEICYISGHTRAVEDRGLMRDGSEGSPKQTNRRNAKRYGGVDSDSP